MGVPKCCGQEDCSKKDVPMTNDKRCQLINEVKELIGFIENEEKRNPHQNKRPDRTGVAGIRDLEEECGKWRKRWEYPRPLITAIALHETRPTSDYSNMKYENSSQVTYVDATKEGQEWRKVPPAPWDLPRTPSQELRSGTLYTSCRCLKRDGLQYDCPRWECAGRPECVAVNPGPCCVPSQWPKPIRGDRRNGNRDHEEKTKEDKSGANLKTGPMNAKICKPIQTPERHPRSPGVGQQEVKGFIAGARFPQQAGVVDVMAVGPMHQSYQQGPLVDRNAPFSQSINPRGKYPPSDVVMVLDLNQILPKGQNRHFPQIQEDYQEAPSTTRCLCRPIENEQAVDYNSRRQGIMTLN